MTETSFFHRSSPPMASVYLISGQAFQVKVDTGHPQSESSMLPKCTDPHQIALYVPSPNSSSSTLFDDSTHLGTRSVSGPRMTVLRRSKGDIPLLGMGMVRMESVCNKLTTPPFDNWDSQEGAIPIILLLIICEPHSGVHPYSGPSFDIAI